MAVGETTSNPQGGLATTTAAVTTWFLTSLMTTSNTARALAGEVAAGTMTIVAHGRMMTEIGIISGGGRGVREIVTAGGTIIGKGGGVRVETATVVDDGENVHALLSIQNNQAPPMLHGNHTRYTQITARE